MKKLLIAGILIVSITATIGYFGLGFNQVSQNQQALDDTANSANLESCESTKRTMCQVGQDLSESDYPESCFENGENIVEDPYQCPS